MGFGIILCILRSPPFSSHPLRWTSLALLMLKNQPKASCFQINFLDPHFKHLCIWIPSRPHRKRWKFLTNPHLDAMPEHRSRKGVEIAGHGRTCTDNNIYRVPQDNVAYGVIPCVAHLVAATKSKPRPLTNTFSRYHIALWDCTIAHKDKKRRPNIN